MEAQPNLFHEESKFDSFKSITSKTVAPSRQFNQAAYNATEVEFNSYFDLEQSNEKGFKLRHDYAQQVIADAKLFKSSIHSGECSLECIEAMVRLSMNVRTKDDDYVLVFSKHPLMRLPIDLPKPHIGKDKIDVTAPSTSASDQFMAAMSLKDETPVQFKQVDDPIMDAASLISCYSYCAAFFIRYAYKLPGTNWNDKMTDFRVKYQDMLKKTFPDITPSEGWAKSLNEKSRDVKYKFRIVIHMIMTTNSYFDKEGQRINAERQKMFRYLFASPFAYYGLTPMMQLFKTAQTMGLNVPKLMSAINVTEIHDGVEELHAVMTTAQTFECWCYCRAFDDTFFSCMSKLSVKRVSYVCMIMQNLKGGQSRPIRIEEVTSLAAVADKDQLNVVAAQIVVAIDASRPATTTSNTIRELLSKNNLKQKVDDYVNAIKKNNSVINQAYLEPDWTKHLPQ